MGIGVNAWVWTSPFTDKTLNLLDKAKKMGFDSFEVPVEDPKNFTLSKLKDAFKRTGLKPCVRSFARPDQRRSEIPPGEPRLHRRTAEDRPSARRNGDRGADVQRRRQTPSGFARAEKEGVEPRSQGP
jgi:sugar phosphate isomerase/epimerase